MLSPTSELLTSLSDPKPAPSVLTISPGLRQWLLAFPTACRPQHQPSATALSPHPAGDPGSVPPLTLVLDPARVDQLTPPKHGTPGPTPGLPGNSGKSTGRSPFWSQHSTAWHPGRPPQVEKSGSGPGWEKHTAVSRPTQQRALEGRGGTIWSGERASRTHTFRLQAGSELYVLAVGDCNHAPKIRATTGW